MAAAEDGDDIFSWKCAKISLNNVKAFITVVMNWPKGKKTSGQNLIEDLKRIRARGLMKKGGKKPLRTYEQCVRQIAWAVREASEGVIEEARKMKGVSGKEKKEGLDEARVAVWIKMSPRPLSAILLRITNKSSTSFGVRTAVGSSNTRSSASR